MKRIDEQQLETNLANRYEYLAEFIGFTPDDVEAIHRLAPRLTPHIPKIVEQTYAKLLSYDATARHFLPRQSGYEGDLPASLAELGPEARQIQFRKEHLRRYLTSLVGNAYDARMVNYLDVVGKIHTPRAGNKAIDVPLVQMNALLGLLADLLVETIHQLELEPTVERQSLRAFNKLLWIQNDFVNRHYAGSMPQMAPTPTPPPAASAWR